MISKFGWGWCAGIVAAVLGDLLFTFYGFRWPVLILSIAVYVVVYVVFFKASGGHDERP